MLTFLFPPFSLSLSLFFFSRLLTNFFFFYLSVFDSIFCFLSFFGGFLMFLWFLLHCALYGFSSLINLSFPSLFLVNSSFLAFRSRWFSPRLVFPVFLLCFQPSFVLSVGFFRISKTISLRLIIYFCCYQSLSFSPSLYLILCFEF